MLFNILNGIFSGNKYSIISIVVYILVILTSLTLHECAHGYVSYKLGDPTAKMRGRLSLNPKDHLDPAGALMMLLFGFGWAKPVPVNPNYYKNRKLGMALTAFAGPLSNLLSAFIGVLLFELAFRYLFPAVSSATVIIICIFAYFTVMLNISLAIFNLIPVPPLDGSRILNVILPEKYYFKVMAYERYIYLVIVLALFTGILDGPLFFVRDLVVNFFDKIVPFAPFADFMNFMF